MLEEVMEVMVAMEAQVEQDIKEWTVMMQLVLLVALMVKTVVEVAMVEELLVAPMPELEVMFQ
jgi:hypothetical protein